MDSVCVRVSAVCNPAWDEAGYIGYHEESVRGCEPLWRQVRRLWWDRYAERCHACGGTGAADGADACAYCAGRGEVMPRHHQDQEPAPSPLCVTDAGDCLTSTDILAQDLGNLARELRRVDNIIRTECALDDECEDEDREWEVTPCEALDLCHRAYDMMKANRLLILAMVLGAPKSDVATNARACFDALMGLRMPLLSPLDSERPLSRLWAQMGFDAKRPAARPSL